MRFLADALVLGSGNQIRLAGGDYTPGFSEAEPDGVESTGASFVLPNETTLRGGYAGLGAADPDARDIEANPTVLSGALPGGARAGTVVNVLIVTGSIDGVTVRDGYRGIALLASLFTVSNTKIIGNVRAYIATNCNLEVSSCYVANNFRGGKHIGGGQAVLRDTEWRRNGSGTTEGGGVHLQEIHSATIIGCTFVDNTSIVVGGAYVEWVGTYLISESTFHGNSSLNGVGGVFAWESAGVIAGSTFTENTASLFPSALVFGGETDPPTTLLNCTFARNEGVLFPCVGISVPNVRVANCVFSRNETSPNIYWEGPLLGETFAAGLYTTDFTIIDNCTFSRNVGGALYAEAPALVRNSLFWQNEPQHYEGSVSVQSVIRSDDEPMFVQPGRDDLRLVLGSPAVDGGDSSIPSGLLVDRDGNPRVQGLAVDVGAYEGSFLPEPVIAEAPDIDPYEYATLTPEGAGFFPLEHSSVIILSESARPDQSATVAPTTSAPTDPDAGYDVIETTLELATSFEIGAFRSIVFVPFDLADVHDASPLEVDLVRFDDTTGTWGLAVAANERAADLAPGKIGRRFVVGGGSSYGFQQTLGDYGLFLYGSRAFAWGVVDRPGSYAAGISRCRADNAQPPDGAVNWHDLLAVVSAWGRGDGPFDIDRNGDVGATDIIALISAWGMCP